MFLRLFLERGGEDNQYTSISSSFFSPSIFTLRHRTIVAVPLLCMHSRYDADKSGTIDKEELALVLRHLGEGVDNDTLDALMEEADDDGNGEVGAWSAMGVQNARLCASEHFAAEHAVFNQMASAAAYTNLLRAKLVLSQTNSFSFSTLPPPLLWACRWTSRNFAR